MATILALTYLKARVIAFLARDATSFQVTTLALAPIVDGQTYGVTINGNVLAVVAGPTSTFTSIYLALNTLIEALALPNFLVVRDRDLPGFKFRNPAAAPVVFTDAVNATLADISPPAVQPVPHRFGARELAKKPFAPRIVWIPGDDSSGSLGEFGAARFPGGAPAEGVSNAAPQRSLATLHELATVYVEAVDLSAPEDEEKQYEAARILFNGWMRALYRTSPGQFLVLSAEYLLEKKERRHGASIRVLLSVDAKIADAPMTLAPATVVASVEPGLETPSGTDDPPTETIDENSPDVVTPES